MQYMNIAIFPPQSLICTDTSWARVLLDLAPSPPPGLPPVSLLPPQPGCPMMSPLGSPGCLPSCSPWFWPVKQRLVLVLSLWTGAPGSQVSPSWWSLNRRWAGTEWAPENEHTAHPRSPPHAPHHCQALRTLGRHTEHFLLVCTNLSTFILQSQKEFEAQVFKDPNEFNDVWIPKCHLKWVKREAYPYCVFFLLSLEGAGEFGELCVWGGMGQGWLTYIVTFGVRSSKADVDTDFLISCGWVWHNGLSLQRGVTT